MWAQRDHMMWNWHDWGWGWWFVMSAGMLAFWVAVIWLVVAFARGSRSPEADAESVLAGRFARGEIDADDFRQRLELLRERDSDNRAA